MTSLQITDADIPSLEGKVALVTGKPIPQPLSTTGLKTHLRPGGASGIGLAAVKILTSKGAQTFILDLSAPEDGVPPGAIYVPCDCTSWPSLLGAFRPIPHVDIAIANAGVSEADDYLADRLDAHGELAEPQYNVIDVNLRGTINFVRIALSRMRKQGAGGSIVVTASATAYAPEQSLPVYSATKAAVCAPDPEASCGP